VREANRLNIPVIAMVDTCCNPSLIDFVIPANDDATKSIACIVDVMCAAIQEGLEERKLDKDKDTKEVSRSESEEVGEKNTKLRSRKPRAEKTE
jgi:small subunit ribosomal protein S2